MMEDAFDAPIGYADFVQLHRGQFAISQLPQHLWPALYTKLRLGDFTHLPEITLMQPRSSDASVSKSAAGVDSSSSTTSRNSEFMRPVASVPLSREQDVFLVHHAWTFQMHTARTDLEQHIFLVPKFERLLNLSPAVADDWKARRRRVFRAIWPYVGSYSVSVHLESRPFVLWYLEEAMTLCMKHCGDKPPNFRVFPFVQAPQGVVFTVAWPIADIRPGEELTRDWMHGMRDLTDKYTRELVWFGAPQHRNMCISAYERWRSHYDRDDVLFEHTSYSEDRGTFSLNISSPNDRSKRAFLGNNSLRASVDTRSLRAVRAVDGRRLRVLTETQVIASNLDSRFFEVVDNWSQADIIFMSHVHSDFETLLPHQVMNQQPREAAITSKALLVNAIRSFHGVETDWFPLTFNLHDEAPAFVGYCLEQFEQSEPKGDPSELRHWVADSSTATLWVVRPWSQAVHTPLVFTSNLAQIMRLKDGVPKLVSRYVLPIALCEGRKFSLRFVMIVEGRGSHFLIHLYNDFLVRMAEKEFTLDEDCLDDPRVHVTRHQSELRSEEFIRILETNHKCSWTEVLSSIRNTFRLLVTAVTEAAPPHSYETSPAGRGWYGVDVILTRDLRPVIMDVAFQPDCRTFLETNPNFYLETIDEMFDCGIVEEEDEELQGIRGFTII